MEHVVACRDWFDLPRTHIDEKMKRDLRLLRLRAAMDTKRFYKTPDSTKFPTYFQVGTVVQGPTDFYGSERPVCILPLSRRAARRACAASPPAPRWHVQGCQDILTECWCS